MLNAATISRVGRAGLAGFALVILSASLANAVYGPKSTIGANYQQWSNTLSRNGKRESDCDHSHCYVLFQQAPEKKPLIIQHVSCMVFVGTGDLRQGVLSVRDTTGAVTFPLRRSYLLPIQTSGWWVVNSPVMQLVEPGERPLVYFLNSTIPSSWTIQCSISGQLQQP